MLATPAGQKSRKKEEVVANENHTSLYSQILPGTNDTLVFHRNVYPYDEFRVALY